MVLHSLPCPKPAVGLRGTGWKDEVCGNGKLINPDGREQVSPEFLGIKFAFRTQLMALKSSMVGRRQIPKAFALLTTCSVKAASVHSVEYPSRCCRQVYP